MASPKAQARVAAVFNMFWDAFTVVCVFGTSMMAVVVCDGIAAAVLRQLEKIAGFHAPPGYHALFFYLSSLVVLIICVLLGIVHIKEFIHVSKLPGALLNPNNGENDDSGHA